MFCVHHECRSCRLQEPKLFFPYSSCLELYTEFCFIIWCLDIDTVVSKFSAAATLWNWENNCVYGTALYTCRKLNIDYEGVNFSVKKRNTKFILLLGHCRQTKYGVCCFASFQDMHVDEIPAQSKETRVDQKNRALYYLYDQKPFENAVITEQISAIPCNHAELIVQRQCKSQDMNGSILGFME